ncbi:thioredoxin-like protein [Williamsia limnetica]|jgi:protein-disulfide isomerase|uniref:Thioredoxin-like protein n=1 Tax=Williamsia limnetica TaxID=882452 RepID=A0A318RQZ9_WILLI|nr:thioredoxin-like protein [Williamsia limnetica]
MGMRPDRPASCACPHALCDNVRVSDIHPDRHLYGNPDAPVRIVEYGDFECPYCGAAAPVLTQVVDESNGRVCLIFRHFPLFEVHPFALTAALAAEASGDRFWNMHAELFAHQDHLDDSHLAEYAYRAGVVDSVIGLAAQPYKAAVEADYNRGIGEGVRGTPSLFVDGVRYTGDIELDALRAATGSG